MLKETGLAGLPEGIVTESPELRFVESVNRVRRSARRSLEFGELGRFKAHVENALTTAMVIGLIVAEQIDPNTLRQKGSVILASVLAGVKVLSAIRTLKENSERKRGTYSIEHDDLSKRQQMYIANNGSFDHKTALMFNPGLREEVLAHLRRDSEFALKTEFEREDMTERLKHLRRQLEKNRGDERYERLLETAEGMIIRYQNTLDLLGQNTMADDVQPDRIMIRRIRIGA
ncbi:MAG: hypothetical protein KGH72_05955 [Candidatus Micrarchaeota archaeon]|nr:hypothetical protein [Candidatus Micrarchaeota archaeon]